MKLALIGAALALGLTASAIAQSGSQGSSGAVVQPPLTKDRLSDEALREIVKQPLAKILAGDAPGGERDFEALLQERGRTYGPTSVEVADALTAMGVSLYSAVMDSDNQSLKKKSLDYLRRAIPATRAAFGANDPEVALALDSYATLGANLDRAGFAVEAESALQEAYRIRSASLGPLNQETVDTLAQLAGVEGLSWLTRGDPSKIAEASRLFSEAVADAQRNSKDRPLELARLYLSVAKFWAQNDNVELASGYFAKAEQQYGESAPQGDQSISDEMAFNALDFASALNSTGHKAEAEALRKRYATRIAAMIARAKHTP